MRARASSARAAGDRDRDAAEQRSAERALQLLEEALVVAGRSSLVRRALELLEQAPLLVGQAARDDDVDEHAVVAAAEALRAPACPRPRSTRTSPGCVPGVELELDLAVERRDRDRRAERRLRRSSGRPARTMSLPSRTKRGSGRTRTWT